VELEMAARATYTRVLPCLSQKQVTCLFSWMPTNEGYYCFTEKFGNPSWWDKSCVAAGEVGGCFLVFEIWIPCGASGRELTSPCLQNKQ
jgi:hypothetical protein